MIIRGLVFRLFRRTAKLFWGTGIGKLPLVNRVFMFLQERLKPRELVLVEVEGNKMYVDPWDIRDNKLLSPGTYNEEATEVFKREIRPGMTVIDLGAHIGFYTLLAAKLVGKGGNVFAFEPAPDNYALLTRNIAANGYTNIVAMQRAVSNEAGQMSLVLQDSYGHYLSAQGDSKQAHATVEAIALDDMFTEDYGPVDFIKMNIEGYEMAALQGMSKLMQKNTHLKIITEFCPEFLTRAGFSPEEFLKTLLGHGFSIYDIRRDLVITEAGIQVTLKEYGIKDGLTFLFCQREQR